MSAAPLLIDRPRGKQATYSSPAIHPTASEELVVGIVSDFALTEASSILRQLETRHDPDGSTWQTLAYVTETLTRSFRSLDHLAAWRNYIDPCLLDKPIWEVADSTNEYLHLLNSKARWMRFACFPHAIYRAFDFVSTESPTKLQHIETSQTFWFAALYEMSRGEIGDDHIIKMFDLIDRAVYGNGANAVSSSLCKIDVSKLAVEFIVGIPRALFPIRAELESYEAFIGQGRAELVSRGLDAGELLQGLC